MGAEYIVIGHFKYVDDTKSAIVALRESGVSNLQLFSPVPNHELEDELYKGRKPSGVRLFVLFGALFGCLGAFLMTTWMSIDWPLRTSAKPAISIPAFVVIAFECTVLIGCIMNLLGMFHHARLPAILGFPAFRPNFTSGTFGLVARVEKERSDQVAEKLKSLGAQKIETQYVR